MMWQHQEAMWAAVQQHLKHFQLRELEFQEKRYLRSSIARLLLCPIRHERQRVDDLRGHGQEFQEKGVMNLTQRNSRNSLVGFSCSSYEALRRRLLHLRKTSQRNFHDAKNSALRSRKRQLYEVKTKLLLKEKLTFLLL